MKIGVTGSGRMLKECPTERTRVNEKEKRRVMGKNKKGKRKVETKERGQNS